MINRLLVLTIAFLTLTNLCHSQETINEKVEKDGVNNQMTITKEGMYNGSTSEKAKEYFDQAAEFEYENQLDVAEKLYLQAIKEDSTFVEAYDNLGLLYRRTGEFKESIKYYKKSIKIYPNGKMAHQNLAVVYSMEKNYENSISEYETILKISPKDPEGYFGLANSYLMLSEFDNALGNAHKALAIYEETNSHHIADGHYMVGLINYYKGDKDIAKQNLQLAKDHGAKINPQIEAELFNTQHEKKAPYQLESKEDYAKHEQDVKDGYNWLMDNPINSDPTKRKEINAFLMQWITGSPNVSIELSEKIVTYMDCADCLMVFLAGWTNYALESSDFKNKVNGNLAGTESVIKFYLLNKKSIGKNKAIEKLIKLKKKEKLQGYIESNI